MRSPRNETFATFMLAALVSNTSRAIMMPKTLPSARGLLVKDQVRRCNMALAGVEDSVKVVLCGPRTGVAGLLANRLKEAGGSREVVLSEDSTPLVDQVGAPKVVVASTDGGPDGEEGSPDLVGEIVERLSPSTEYLVWIETPEGRRAANLEKSKVGFVGGLLARGSKTPLETVRSLGGRTKSVVVHTGRLFGTSTGGEPIPFLTGPKAEPVLDESITRQAVLVGPGTVLSSAEDAATKRSSVAEAIERLLAGGERQRGLELSVVSIEGFPTTDDEWAEEFERLDDSAGVAVFSVDFDAILKKEQLLRWLVDSWAPAALRTSTAAMVRSGARPVAVAATDEGAELMWETLKDDLTPINAGKLSIVIKDEPAGLRVNRVVGQGQTEGTVLSGEEEIVQSLLKGVSTVAYPKGYVKRKAPRTPVTARSASNAASTSRDATGAPERRQRETAAAVTQDSDSSPSPERQRTRSKGRGRRSGGRRKS